MKKIASLLAIASLAASGAVFAQQPSQSTQQQPVQKPVAMTEAQMDNVTAGALLNVALVDVVDVRDVNVQVGIPVNANVAVGVLGGAVATGLQQPGRIIGF